MTSAPDPTSTPPGDLALSALLQLSMPVTDINRAVAFYRDVLGVTFLFQAGTLGFFDLDGVRLMLAEPEGEGAQAAPCCTSASPTSPRPPRCCARAA